MSFGPHPSAARSTHADRRLARWAAAVSLVPLPVWFVVAAALSPRPAWRAEYRDGNDPAAAGSVSNERELERYWDRTKPLVPGGYDAKRASARWQTCLSLERALDVPFLLVTDGSARFTIDGVERLRADAGKRRITRGEVLRLEAGTHQLGVELQAHGWPSIALEASFDGNPPQPVGSGVLAPGVVTSPPDGGACAPP